MDHGYYEKWLKYRTKSDVCIVFYSHSLEIWSTFNLHNNQPWWKDKQLFYSDWIRLPLVGWCLAFTLLFHTFHIAYKIENDMSFRLNFIGQFDTNLTCLKIDGLSYAFIVIFLFEIDKQAQLSGNVGRTQSLCGFFWLW